MIRISNNGTIDIDGPLEDVMSQFMFLVDAMANDIGIPEEWIMECVAVGLEENEDEDEDGGEEIHYHES